MTDSTKDGVVIATQFSRLRRTAAAAEQSPQVDMGYEALAALSEVMQVLSEMLTAKLEGRTLCDERRRRVAERAELLAEHVRRLYPSEDTQSGEAALPSRDTAKRALD